VYNIQKAVSRLDYAPSLKEIEVTDFKKGLGVFTPKPDKPASFTALKQTLKKAGYTLAAADITVAGVLAKDENGWSIVVQSSGQRFALQGPNVEQVVAGANPGASIEITGEWKTVGTGQSAHESISPMLKTSARRRGYRTEFTGSFRTTSYFQPPVEEVVANPLATHHAKPLAPIRVTSPGLTVYKGGAVTPRFYVVNQHLGNLEVTRQVLDISVSYTPSPRLQLELNVPLARTAFDNETSSGSGFGLGNITAWAKYRFFRTVKTYGDRQAALRVGFEMPTGKKAAPTQAQLNVSEFVRQQLTPINGGLAPHFDLAFSQAGGRFIFGGNAEVIFRAERDGFRMGHEQRVSTDLEYVLPRDDRKPGGELFLVLETSLVHRGRGRVNGRAVEGSRATEFYVAPGLQYAARPQFVIEGSYQFPVVRNTGPEVLRTDRNILLGVRYLF
jgi:hypothetical protein